MEKWWKITYFSCGGYEHSFIKVSRLDLGYLLSWDLNKLSNFNYATSDHEHMYNNMTKIELLDYCPNEGKE